MIADPGPGGLVTVHVLLKFSVGATGVSFSAPVPQFAGLQWVADTLTPGFTALGTSQTQVDVDFGTCVPGTIPVMQMLFVRVGEADPCVEYLIQTGASFLDCSLVEHFNIDSSLGVGLNATAGGHFCSSTYKRPSPANAAVGIPLSTHLSWNNPSSVWCLDPVAAAPADVAGTGNVHFGTTTDPPYDAAATLNQHVSGLQPLTTYYWRIVPAVGSPGPLWSFTTAFVLPTKQSTWGAIKALYR
jgi:hypothetical protein